MPHATLSQRPVLNTPDATPIVQPSAGLRGLVRQYFEVLDKRSHEPAASPALNELILNAMQAEGIPFNSEQEARGIARWLASGEPVKRGKQRQIMFAHIPEHRHITEYDPIRDGVGELTNAPFVDSDDERLNAGRRIPVMVTVEPLADYGDATFGRNK
jgi:hypothetical protein